MPVGFYIIMAAQFFSSLADNALLVAAIAMLALMDSPAWLTPMLKLFFTISYVVLAPFVGAMVLGLARPRPTAHFLDDPPPDSFVREPRRPRPSSSSGGVALELPPDLL